MSYDMCLKRELIGICSPGFLTQLRKVFQTNLEKLGAAADDFDGYEEDSPYLDPTEVILQASTDFIWIIKEFTRAGNGDISEIVSETWVSFEDFNDEGYQLDEGYLLRKLKIVVPGRNVKYYFRELVRCTTLPKLAVVISLGV
jgi:hypothetical protein